MSYPMLRREGSRSTDQVQRYHTLLTSCAGPAGAKKARLPQRLGCQPCRLPSRPEQRSLDPQHCGLHLQREKRGHDALAAGAGADRHLARAAAASGLLVVCHADTTGLVCHSGRQAVRLRDAAESVRAEELAVWAGHDGAQTRVAQAGVVDVRVRATPRACWLLRRGPRARVLPASRVPVVSSGLRRLWWLCAVSL